MCNKKKAFPLTVADPEFSVGRVSTLYFANVFDKPIKQKENLFRKQWGSTEDEDNYNLARLVGETYFEFLLDVADVNKSILTFKMFLYP